MKKLTAENLLSCLSDEAIFRAFINTPFILKKAFHSPLRTDKNPSFVIFPTDRKTLLFKDFATGECGDCFEFVKKLHGINFNEALILIAKRFGIDNEFEIYNKRNLVIDKTNIEAKTSTINKIIITELFYKFYYDDNVLFKEDLDYYNQYKIQQCILDKFLVKRVREVVRDIIKNDTEFREIYDFHKTPSYLYHSIKLENNNLVKGGFKIHKPFDNTRFISFCDSSTLFYNPYLFSKKEEDKLNPSLLFITKSMKDSMVLTALGFYSLAIQGEGIKPENLEDIIFKCIEELIRLEHLDMSFKLVFLFDNDEAGINCSTRFMYYFEDIYNSYEIKCPVELGKDISDCVKATSLDFMKEWVLNKLR